MPIPIAARFSPARTLVAVAAALALGKANAAEFSASVSPSPESAPAEAAPGESGPAEPFWPVVLWGVQEAMVAEPTLWDEAADPRSWWLPLTAKREQLGFAMQNEPLHESLGATPPILPTVPALAPQINTGANRQNDPAQLGDASFSLLAERLNGKKIDVPQNDEVARRLRAAASAPSVPSGAPITGWAMVGFAVLALGLALGIGYNEKGRKERKSRRKHRHSRSHHRRRRSSS